MVFLSRFLVMSDDCYPILMAFLGRLERLVSVASVSVPTLEFIVSGKRSPYASVSTLAILGIFDRNSGGSFVNLSQSSLYK